MSTMEELDMVETTRRLERAFLAAKTSRTTNPAEYEKAKKEFIEHRAYWRGIREYLNAHSDGTIIPATILTEFGAN